MSFRDAASELQLTQGAISRQIKTLEDSLGLPLFIRHTRKVELTDAGETLFSVARDALDMIEQTTSSLKDKPQRKTLVISALPTLTSVWIMPRLHTFIEEHRNIEVRIVASIEAVDFLNDSIDVAIRVGQLPGRRYAEGQPRIDLKMVESWNGVRADELFPDALLPVLSPSLARRREIREPKDLLQYPLIHTSTRRFAWPDWLQAHGISNMSRAEKKYEFSHFFMSLDAAARGQGIAILPRVVLSLYKDIDKLVLPFNSDVPSAGSYYVLTRESQSKSREINALRHWVMTEAKTLRTRA
jgi:LysR family glycine cleavage system transcriptional activator